MKFTIYQPNSTRLVFSTLFAAAIAFGTPGVANAEDPSWDVDVYDTCIESSWDAADSDPDADSIDWNTVIDLCCTRSGGVTVGPANDTACVAPPAEPAGRSPGAPGGPGAEPKPGQTPPQVSNPGLAPPPTPTTTPLVAPAPAPGLAPR